MRHYKIGELAAAAGVRRDTVRYYEKLGLLRKPDRTSSGYRVYDAVDLERLNFIRAAQNLGFTLENSRQLLNIRSSDDASAKAVLDIAYAKIKDTESRLRRLIDIRDALQMLADQCPVEVPASDCPILHYLSSKQ